MSKPLNISKDGLTPEQAEYLIEVAKNAEQALWHIEAVLHEAKPKLDEHTPAHQLISLALHHAMDQANVADSMIESLENGGRV